MDIEFAILIYLDECDATILDEYVHCFHDARISRKVTHTNSCGFIFNIQKQFCPSLNEAATVAVAQHMTAVRRAVQPAKWPYILRV